MQCIKFTIIILVLSQNCPMECCHSQVVIAHAHIVAGNM